MLMICNVKRRYSDGERANTGLLQAATRRLF
jgi:hypothetical protein